MDELIMIPTISRETGIHAKSLRKHQSQLPGLVVIGRRRYYRRSAIVEFLRTGGALGTVSTSAVPVPHISA